MLDNFNKGLGKETNATARVKMFQTYVKSVPDGTGKTFLLINIHVGKHKLKNDLNTTCFF